MVLEVAQEKKSRSQLYDLLFAGIDVVLGRA